MAAKPTKIRVHKVLTHLQEILPHSPGSLRETLTGDMSPGVDSPAEKQEVEFWKSVLETLDKHGHDYKAAVTALRTSAKLRVEELSENYVDQLRRRSRMRQPGDCLNVKQAIASGGGSALVEHADPAKVARRLQTPESYLASLRVRGLR